MNARHALSPQRQQWFEAACRCIDSSRLRSLVRELTDLHSPTGAERKAAAFLAGTLNAAGFEAQLLETGSAGGNCAGRLPGSGKGATLMLYAPLDTHLDADPDRDIPWVGPALRDDMRPFGRVQGDDFVVGLGAGNPKAMVATITEAARCVAEAGIPLEGDLIVAAAGGGMPWRVRERDDAGISSGVLALLDRISAPDFAVIVKPWDEVYYEHPGMVWLKVTVAGTLGYAGIPRGVPGFTSAIVPAARLVLELEDWLIRYPARHAAGQVRPEGWIGAVRSGWPDKPAFPPAACQIWIDVRIGPEQTVADLEREFSGVLQDIMRRHPDVQAQWEVAAACPAARTDPGHWIVRSALNAWEAVHHRPYPGAPPMSGQTDAAAICRRGIPVVRVGFPFLEPERMPPDWREGLGGMGVACIPDLVGACRLLIRMIVDACTRPRAELGL